MAPLVALDALDPQQVIGRRFVRWLCLATLGTIVVVADTNVSDTHMQAAVDTRLVDYFGLLVVGPADPNAPSRHLMVHRCATPRELPRHFRPQMTLVSRLRTRIIKVSPNITASAPIFLTLSLLPSASGTSPTHSPSALTRSKRPLVKLTRLSTDPLRRGGAGPTAKFRLKFAIGGARLVFPRVFTAGDREKVALGAPFLGRSEQVFVLGGLHRLQLLVLVLALTGAIQVRFVYLAHKAHHFIVICGRAMPLS